MLLAKALLTKRFKDTDIKLLAESLEDFQTLLSKTNYGGLYVDGTQSFTAAAANR